MNNNEVLNFIQRRFSIDCNWMTSNSYWFARILSLRFAALHVYYNPVDSHFVAADVRDDIYFDYEGLHKVVPKECILVDNLLYEEPTRYLELMKLFRE